MVTSATSKAIPVLQNKNDEFGADLRDGSRVLITGRDEAWFRVLVFTGGALHDRGWIDGLLLRNTRIEELGGTTAHKENVFLEMGVEPCTMCWLPDFEDASAAKSPLWEPK